MNATKVGRLGYADLESDLNFSEATTVRSVAATGELAGFEAARFIAAVFVVWIHASIGVDIYINPDPGFLGRFAVPFFVLSSVFFASLSLWGRANKKPIEYLLTRFTRIYLPFVVWSLIYAAIKGLQGRPIPWSTPLLWDGTSYQLWYLPFIMVVSIIFFPLQRLTIRVPEQAMKIAALFLITGIGLAITPRAWFGDTSIAGSFTPSLWLNAVPSALIGFSLACYYGFGDRNIFTSKSVAWVSGILVPICVMATCLFPAVSPALLTAAGVSLGIFALSVSIGEASGLSAVVAKLAPLGKLSFGIYLSHILFIGPLRSIAASKGLSTTIPFAIIATLVATLLAMVLTYGMLQTRWLRWMVK